MPLPLANLNLDDRRWADLVEEGRALIPRHTPGWTDHNLSDPGIALIELFAWLTEQSIYRLNQVPERHRRKFLGLIGYPPQPPQPAQAVLAIRSWELPPIAIPSGFELEANDAEGRSVAFRTLRDLTAAPVELAAIRVGTGDGTLIDHTRDWSEGLPVAVLGNEPRPGAALHLGFKVSEYVDLTLTEIPISLSFHFEGTETGPDGRTRLNEEAGEQRVAQCPVLPDIRCDEELEEVGQLLPVHHSARLVWEVLMGPGGTWTLLDPIVNGARPGPGQIWDDTRSLTLDGIVELSSPLSIEPASLNPEDPEEGPLYWLRCRLEAGAYDAAPLLRNLVVNAVMAGQAIPAEHGYAISETASMTFHSAEPTAGDLVRLQMSLDSGGAISNLTFLDSESDDALGHPELQVLDYVARSAGHPGSLALDLVALGVGSTGLPEQEVTLPHAPVQQSSLTLYTHLEATEEGWRSWIRRDDLDASRRTDRHFTLDATTGAIGFGDGERGQVPEAGALIFARYCSTRAEAGNLRAGSSFRPATTERNGLALSEDERKSLDALFYNPLDAGGGAAAETLAQATGRAVDILHAHERLVDLAAEYKQRTLDQIPRGEVMSVAPPARAVNLLDLERLALNVPGTQVERARAWSGVHPSYPCLRATGVVTLVVLPYLPLGRPEPSPGLLAAVRRYLDCRRMVTTRLEVVGPRYLEVSVRADVRTKPLVDAARVRVRIIEAIDAFFDPLTGGPEGLGWPFGRYVFRSEILQLIDGVPGVDHVLDLALVAGESEPSCGNLSLCPTWLLSSGEHRVRVNPPTDDRDAAASGLAPCPLPVGTEPNDGTS